MAFTIGSPFQSVDLIQGLYTLIVHIVALYFICTFYANLVVLPLSTLFRPQLSDLTSTVFVKSRCCCKITPLKPLSASSLCYAIQTFVTAVALTFDTAAVLIMCHGATHNQHSSGVKRPGRKLGLLGLLGLLGPFGFPCLAFPKFKFSTFQRANNDNIDGPRSFSSV